MENNLIERKKDVEEVNTMSPLTWAYIGDCVFEMYVRMFFINTTRLKPHAMHLEVIKELQWSWKPALERSLQWYPNHLMIRILSTVTGPI